MLCIIQLHKGKRDKWPPVFIRSLAQDYTISDKKDLTVSGLILSRRRLQSLFAVYIDLPTTILYKTSFDALYSTISLSLNILLPKFKFVVTSMLITWVGIYKVCCQGSADELFAIINTLKTLSISPHIFPEFTCTTLIL